MCFHLAVTIFDLHWRETHISLLLSYKMILLTDCIRVAVAKFQLKRTNDVCGA